MEQLIHTAARIPWNKGKLVGQKAPLKLRHLGDSSALSATTLSFAAS